MDDQSSFPRRASITVYIDGTFVQGRLEGSGIRDSRIWGDDDFPEDTPLPGVYPSDAQKAHQEKFKQAVAYARAAMNDPELRSHYQKAARALNKRPRNLAFSDYFKRQKRRKN
jgi:hypothetical protein